MAVNGSAVLTLTRQPHAGDERSQSERRRGSSARCSKHASRLTNLEKPSRNPFDNPLTASTLRQPHATTCDPSSGTQFLTRDPLEALTRSAYGYVFGDPLNTVDPTGLAPWDGIVSWGQDRWSDFTCGFSIARNEVNGFLNDAAYFSRA